MKNSQKRCNVIFVYRTYALEEEADTKFSLSDVWNLFQGDTYQQRKQFLQANDKLYEGVELPTKNIRSSTEHQDHQESTQDHDGR